MLAKYDDIMTPYFNLFDYEPFSLSDSLLRSTRSRSSSNYRTKADDTGLTLSIDLPGVKSKDLTVQSTGKSLVVSGKLRDEDFKQTYRISKDYDVNGVEASLEDGVLTLSFKRTVEATPKMIEVQVK